MRSIAIYCVRRRNPIMKESVPQIMRACTKRSTREQYRSLLQRLVLISLLLSGFAGAQSDLQTTAEQILKESGVTGGLIVHVGCGDGRLTAALFTQQGRLVHGLDSDSARIESARRYIQSRNLYGPVSVDLWSGSRLPYADHLARLVVVSPSAPVPPKEEILRVLAPNGKALFLDESLTVKKGSTIEKPWPELMDHWTHYLYDSSNNAVSKDRIVGPLRSMRWAAEPNWLRSHNWYSSFMAMVSAGGRLFYLIDTGPAPLAGQKTGTEPPQRWQLMARDAFSGVELWGMLLADSWDARDYEFTGPAGSLWGTPLTVNRRVVATDERVFATLKYRGPVSILDAATGSILGEVKTPGHVEEILHRDGVLYLRVRDIPPRPEKMPGGGQRAKLAELYSDYIKNLPPERVVAARAENGEVLWESPARLVAGGSLAAAQGRVCYHDLKDIVALDAKTGKELWRTPASPSFPADRTLVRGIESPVVLYKDYALFSAGDGLVCLDAATGKQLWKNPRARIGIGFSAPTQLDVINGIVWAGTGRMGAGLDVKTGAEARRLDLGEMLARGHHIRCFRGKATERYLITPMRGAEFIDLEGEGLNMVHDWMRGACGYGVMPANGLLYGTPDPCQCYSGTKVNGFNAFAAQIPAGIDIEGKTFAARLERGPAFAGDLPSQISDFKSQIAQSQSAEWPMYRRDAARSGSAPAARVPTTLTPRWSASLGGDLTQPVIAEGRVLVCDRASHTIHCLDAATGQRRWDFIAGGPVDTPPTLAGGRAFLGGSDGWVYCLQANDGAVIWRFRAAPGDQRIVAREKVESVWPCHGSVIVSNGLVYATAGRSSFLDEGIFVFALDAATGEVRHHGRLEGPWPSREQLRAGVRKSSEGGRASDEENGGGEAKGGKKSAKSGAASKASSAPAGTVNALNVVDFSKDWATGYDTEGARSDILVSDGAALYMSQAKLDMTLRQVPTPRSKWDGRRAMGARHLMATAGFLDDTYFHRASWLYSDTWPGFPTATGAANAGVILVFDRERSYAAKLYGTSRYPDHPTGSGVRLVADRLDAPSYTLDEKPGGGGGVGTAWDRGAPPVWETGIPLLARAMVVTTDADGKGQAVFVAGAPDVTPEGDSMAAYDGRTGAKLVSVAAADGEKLAECDLSAAPVFDGMAAAMDSLFVSLENGELLRLGSSR